MTSPFNSQTWSNPNNAGSMQQQQQHHHGQQNNYPQPVAPNQVHNPMVPGPGYPQPLPAQPTYWNNNNHMTQKPQTVNPNIWGQGPQQYQPNYNIQQAPQYPGGVYNAPQLPQQQQHQQQQQQPLQQNNDPWSWGWDESTNNSPQSNQQGAPATNNNDAVWDWNIDEESTQDSTQNTTPYNPVASYFQPGGQTKPDNIPQEEETEEKEIKQEFKLKDEEDIKTEVVEPDKIPLTTEALRDFHKEVYENGRTRHIDGLTPQWSIESQMSQDTGSDISPSIQGGSDVDRAPSDMDTRPSTVSQSPLSTQQQGSFEQNWYEYPETISEENSQIKDNSQQEYDNRFISVRNDLYETNNVTSSTFAPVMTSTLPPGMANHLPPGMASNLPPGVTNTSPPGIGNTIAPGITSTLPPGMASTLPPGIANSITAGIANISLETQTFVENKEIISPEKTEQVPPPRIDVVKPPLPPSNIKTDGNPYSVKRIGPGSRYGNRRSNEPEVFQPVPDQSRLPPLSGNIQNVTQTDFKPLTILPSKPPQLGDESVNLETVPDNKERPDMPDRSSVSPGRQVSSISSNSTMSWNPNQWKPQSSYKTSPENQEVAPRCGPDRNQYLETGQLNEQLDPNLELHDNDMPPPGLSRMVTGEGQAQQVDNNVIDLSYEAPPPGLDRMVPGNDTNLQDDVTQGTPPPGLHRMVLGRLTDDIVPMPTRDDILPPGLHRMIPGESSSPETQNIIVVDQHIDTRVVTGVANDEFDVNITQTTVPLAASSPIPASRMSNSNNSGEERESTIRIQPQSERSETIGSDNVENYTPNLTQDNTSSKRKEQKSRERDNGSSDEKEREHDNTRQRDSYRDRNRERDYSPSDRRYRDKRSKPRDRGDSPGRYREDKDRRRRYKDYEYSDEDGEGNGYFSDRDRRMYRDEYDRSYRARTLDRPTRDNRDRGERIPERKDRRRGYTDRDRDARHNESYYRRGHGADEEEYRENQRSRPQSRNGSSVHDFKSRYQSREYEEGDREHYRSSSKRDRDNAYYQGYNYDPAYYNYYYQYYENLRRTNPAAYAEWCRKYYAHSQGPGTFDGTYTEDRGSVHSGRSSANDEHKDRALDSSLQYEEVNSVAQRLTPAKFTTAHVKGIITRHGQLLKILAHYPLDGQPAAVEIHEQILCTEEMRRELQDFPGPLVKGVTHKNNVLRYCKQKIKEADNNSNIYDKDSYKLIWELLILLIRQNGTVVGTDIAELLMSNKTGSNEGQQQFTPSPATSHHSINEQPSTLSEEEITKQFRDFLIYGNTKEALEWAMKHNLWGHALFLASKMDQRTYAAVMTRFANGLTINDPLQTLYQLMSGRQPAAVTCLSDEKWGDWRPHLAMILSNSTSRPDLDHRAITTLGDTLGARGSLYASHFCYLMAQVEFGSFAQKTSKMVLIGSSHNQQFNKFATNEAIFATEIFEFACNLADPTFTLQHLQVYKLLVARRLLEAGMGQEAVHYVEVISSTIAKTPSQYTPTFIQEVYDLGNTLKYLDPLYTSNQDEGDDLSEPQWLSNLQVILNDYQMGVLQQDVYGSQSNLTYSESEQVQSLPLDSAPEPTLYDPNQWQQNQYYEQQQQQQWQTEDKSGQDNNVNNLPGNQTIQPPLTDTNDGVPSQPYWQNQWNLPQQQQQQPIVENNLQQQNQNIDLQHQQQQQQHQQTSYNYYDNQKNEENNRPRITLPAARQHRISQSEDDVKHKPQQQQQQRIKKEITNVNQSSGWFGGLWNKLSIRPKNQMKLPDDKNPSILWDSDKKRWVNLDSDGDESNGALPPPPKATDLMKTTPQQTASMPMSPTTSMPMPTASMPMPTAPISSNNIAPELPSIPTGPNKYTLSKGKSMRSNYVNVFGSSGTSSATNATVPAPELFPSLTQQPPMANNFFIPSPVEVDNAPTDFLTPSVPAPEQNSMQGDEINQYRPPSRSNGGGMYNKPMIGTTVLPPAKRYVH